MSGFDLLKGFWVMVKNFCNEAYLIYRMMKGNLTEDTSSKPKYNIIFAWLWSVSNA